MYLVYKKTQSYIQSYFRVKVWYQVVPHSNGNIPNNLISELTRLHLIEGLAIQPFNMGLLLKFER